MNKLKNYNLALFFTESIGLKNWEKIGMLQREIEPYNILAEHFNKIYFFTYDTCKYINQDKLASNIKIIYNKYKIKPKLYKYLMPFLEYRTIRKCYFLKTNQMKGSETAIISKIINPSSCLIARTGYTRSIFAKQQKKLTKKITIQEKIIYKICNKGFVTSEEDKKYLINKYKIQKNKITVIPNYINTDIFKPNKDIKKFNNKIIYVGRLNKQKNLFNLLESLKNLNISLDIIGDGPLKNEIIKKSKNQNIKIKFLGNIPNNKIPKILNKYNIFILPSNYEGMPKTLLEAMSCGLACIGTNVAGNRELITNKKTGILTETGIKDLKNGIKKLINDKNLQKELGQNARNFIEKNYSLKKEIKKEIEIYEKMA